MYDNQTLDTVHAKALCFLYKLKKKKRKFSMATNPFDFNKYSSKCIKDHDRK